MPDVEIGMKRTEIARGERQAGFWQHLLRVRKRDRQSVPQHTAAAAVLRCGALEQHPFLCSVSECENPPSFYGRRGGRPLHRNGVRSNATHQGRLAAFDSESLHAKTERGGFDSQERGRALRPFDLSAARLQRATYVFRLNGVETVQS